MGKEKQHPLSGYRPYPERGCCFLWRKLPHCACENPIGNIPCLQSSTGFVILCLYILISLVLNQGSSKIARKGGSPFSCRRVSYRMGLSCAGGGASHAKTEKTDLVTAAPGGAGGAVRHGLAVFQPGGRNGGADPGGRRVGRPRGGLCPHRLHPGQRLDVLPRNAGQHPSRPAWPGDRGA